MNAPNNTNRFATRSVALTGDPTRDAIYRAGGTDNYLGKTFGLLKVIGRARRHNHSNFDWVCLCECGRYTYVSGSHLRLGTIWHCGCLTNRTGSMVIPDISKVDFIPLIPVQGHPEYVLPDRSQVGYRRKGHKRKASSVPTTGQPHLGYIPSHAGAVTTTTTTTTDNGTTAIDANATTEETTSVSETAVAEQPLSLQQEASPLSIVVPVEDDSELPQTITITLSITLTRARKERT